MRLNKVSLNSLGQCLAKYFFMLSPVFLLHEHTVWDRMLFQLIDSGFNFVAKISTETLNDGAIQRRFSADPIFKPVERLLREEQFFDEDQTARAQ